MTTPHKSDKDRLLEQRAAAQIEANYWYNRDVNLFAAYQALIEQLQIKIDDTTGDNTGS